MKETKIKEFIKSLQIDIPPYDDFYELFDKIGGLLLNSRGKIERHVYDRGPLLYSLVTKYRPRNILEFGTGDGLSTLSMAWAMEYNNIPGTIYTIDRFPIDSKREKYVDFHDGNGQKNIFSSNKELWSKVATSKWLEHIKPLPGYSGEIMSKTVFPKIDFAYIDGAHHYEAVRHDFYSFMETAANSFKVLFDDYVDNPLYGVTKFVDTEIVPNFETVALETEEIQVGKLKKTIHKMVVMEGSMSTEIEKLFSLQKRKKILNDYYRYEKYVMIPRQKLNKIFPPLTKIKFKWWQK